MDASPRIPPKDLKNIDFHVNSTAKLREKRDQGHPIKLLDMLYMQRSLYSFPVYKVYSIVSMLADIDLVALEPDYSKPDYEKFREITKIIVESHCPPDICYMLSVILHILTNDSNSLRYSCSGGSSVSKSIVLAIYALYNTTTDTHAPTFVFN